MTEAVSELRVIWRGALSEARIIGRDDVVAIGQKRDQISNMCDDVGNPCNNRTTDRSPGQPRDKKMPTPSTVAVR